MDSLSESAKRVLGKLQEPPLLSLYFGTDHTWRIERLGEIVPNAVVRELQDGGHVNPMCTYEPKAVLWTNKTVDVDAMLEHREKTGRRELVFVDGSIGAAPVRLSRSTSRPPPFTGRKPDSLRALGRKYGVSHETVRKWRRLSAA